MYPRKLLIFQCICVGYFRKFIVNSHIRIRRNTNTKTERTIILFLILYRIVSLKFFAHTHTDTQAKVHVYSNILTSHTDIVIKH